MAMKGILFSTDAIIASIILISSLLLFSNLYVEQQELDHLELLSTDMLNILSEITISEINNTYMQELIDNGDVLNENNTLIEQIGELWALNKTEQANKLAQNLTAQLFPSQYGFSLAVGNEELYTRESTYKRSIIASRRMISGYEKSKPLQGFSSRAFLKSIQQKTDLAYGYFGGFVGQGNITIRMDALPDDAQIKRLTLELDALDTFELYLNDNFCNQFTPDVDNLTANEWDITSCNSSLVVGAENNVTIGFPSNNLATSFIGGGFVKATYRTAEVSNNNTFGNKRFWFADIRGLINLYDEFYVPGELTNMSVYLHMQSNYSTFLNLGNTTLYTSQDNASEFNATLNDTYIQSLINYSELHSKTIPLRLGIEEFSAGSNSGIADIVFLIDSTGSMSAEINDVISIIVNFTQVLENSSIDYRLALIEYKDYPVWSCGGASDFAYRIESFAEGNFTTNATEFRSAVQSLVASGGADLPESHLRAINESLLLEYRSNAAKMNIMLTDADPHALDCSAPAPWYCPQCLGASPPWWCGFYDLGLCVDPNTELACNGGPNNVTEITQRLVNEEIVFYYINKNSGLCDNRIMADNTTNLTGGRYYEYTETEGVQDIILSIAGDIINVTFNNQTANVEGNVSDTILFGDSYIDIEYIPQVAAPEFGEITFTLESDDFRSCSDIVNISEKLRVLESRVSSYSSEHWTSFVGVNSNTVFNISTYGSEYTNIGDPYVVNFNANLLATGPNTISIQTADDPTNTTGCSLNNTLVYLAAVKTSLSYSDVFEKAQGCEWTVEIEGESNITADVPSDYLGGNRCYYTEHNVSYDTTDSINQAVIAILTQLDFDNDNMINIDIAEEDLEIDVLSISQVPYLWGPSIVEVRVWQ